MNRKIKSIAHLSDIHLRLYKRHDEYKIVFARLYEDLEKWKNRYLDGECLIVLTGDIFHAKTDMSPEMVDLASDFFINLSNIAPTIIIAGNHDTNLSNPNRLDSLTPIIENLNLENLHYLKESDVYKFGNVEFGVYSVFGNPSEWPTIDNIKGDIKIALYHGTMLGAKTDTGYIVTNKDVTPSMFDGYDAVMVGDIHKRQYMQLKSPPILYPGSLIQQNFGESETEHGWTEWILDSMDTVHHEIENDYGYITLHAKAGKIPPLLNLPKNVRLRLFIEDIDAAGVKKILAMIRKKCNLIESVVNKESQTQVIQTTVQTDNIQKVEYQNKLIRKYLTDNYPDVDKDILRRVDTINESLNQHISEDELPQNISWKPLRLKFDNLFSYGTGNTINFEEMQGLYGIFSPNATGKTSAFDALSFALYDKTPRAFKGSHIMNTNEKECFCELEFEVSSEHFRIIRTGTRKKGGDVKIDVKFMKKEKDEWVLLSGEDRRDTNAVIRSYVGSYDDFVLTNLSVQNQNSMFIEKGQTDRKDLLSQFLGLTIFDRLYNLAIEENKEITRALKNFKKDDFTQSLVTMQNEIDSSETELNDANATLSLLRDSLNDLSERINELYGQKVPNIKNINPLPIKRDIEVFQKKFHTIDAESIKKLESCSQLKEKLDTLSSSKIRLLEVETKHNELCQIHKNIDQLNRQLELLNSNIKNKEEKLENLKNHKYDSNCSYCMNNVFVKDAIATQNQYDELISKKSVILNDIKKNTEKCVEYVIFESDYIIAKSQSDEYDSIEKSYNKMKEIVSNFNQEKSAIKHSLDSLENGLREYEKNKLHIEENNIIDENIKTLEFEKDKLNKKISDLQLRCVFLSNKKAVSWNEKTKMLESIKEVELLEDEYEAYELYMTAICRDGIPYQLISSVLPSVQNSINRILNQVVDFTVEINVDGKNINANIVYDDKKSWPVELASGMEKFIIGLAIRVALMSVSSLPKSNFIVIDEGLGVLDSDNLSSLFMLFDTLKMEFEWLIIISHLDIVRDIADHLIEIKRENGQSFINV